MSENSEVFPNILQEICHLIILWAGSNAAGVQIGHLEFVGAGSAVCRQDLTDARCHWIDGRALLEHWRRGQTDPWCRDRRWKALSCCKFQTLNVFNGFGNNNNSNNNNNRLIINVPAWLIHSVYQFNHVGYVKVMISFIIFIDYIYSRFINHINSNLSSFYNLKWL